jgi:hypothetical protein
MMLITATTTPTLPLLAVTNHTLGVALFIGVYVLLLMWLVLMPARLLDEPPGHPWWKSSRLWAILIAGVQILAYLALG